MRVSALADDMPLPDVVLEDEECAEELRLALQALNERERFIVEQRWLTDDVAPLEALAEWFEVSKAKVRRIEISAIEKLRQTMQRMRGPTRLRVNEA